MHHELITAGSIAFLLVVASMIGCGEPDIFQTPPPTVTTSPDAAQIKYSRRVMYVNQELEIEPLGYRYEHGFQDDAIAFKFIAKTETISDIFNSDFVEPAKLVLRDTEYGLRNDLTETWWDVANRKLIGDNFIVPPPGSTGGRALNIGIFDNDDGSFTVYVYWFEI